MKLGPKAAATALIVSAALALTACGGGATPARPAGARPHLTLGAVQEVRSWDPAQAHVGHFLQPYQAVYDTLILREPDGKLSPMLATDWKYNTPTPSSPWTCGRTSPSVTAPSSTPRPPKPTWTTSRRPTARRWPSSPPSRT